MSYWRNIVIVKFNSRGAGGGSGPVDYLLGKERDRDQAVTLRGSPEQVKTLIDTSDFARTYTSGVLSFEEKDLPDTDKQQLMDELEQTLYRVWIKISTAFYGFSIRTKAGSSLTLSFRILNCIAEKGFSPTTIVLTVPGLMHGRL